jgi:multiple sugar transport system permease protein
MATTIPVATATRTIRPAGSPSLRERRRARRAYLLLLPTAILLIAIIGYPTAWAIGQSTFSDTLGEAPHFIGFANYANALWGQQAPQFWRAVGDGFFFAVVCSAIELVLGVGMALLLNGLVRFRGALRSFVLVPWAIPTAVGAVLWQYMLQPTGIINAILGHQIIWTAGAWTPRLSIVIIDVWKTTPFIGLLVLAGLQIIPGEVYEAARVDGASAWQRFRWVTLPLAKPAILVALLFRLLDLLRLYDVPSILTNGANDTQTLSLFTYQNAISQVKNGYGSALSTLTFIIIFAAAFAFIRITGVRAMNAGGIR